MKFPGAFISISTMTHWCEPWMLLEFLILMWIPTKLWNFLKKITKQLKKIMRFKKPQIVWEKNVNRCKPLKDFIVCLWKLLSFLNLLDHSWLGILKGANWPLPQFSCKMLKRLKKTWLLQENITHSYPNVLWQNFEF